MTTNNNPTADDIEFFHNCLNEFADPAARKRFRIVVESMRGNRQKESTACQLCEETNTPLNEDGLCKVCGIKIPLCDLVEALSGLADMTGLKISEVSQHMADYAKEKETTKDRSKYPEILSRLVDNLMKEQHQCLPKTK